MGLRRLAKVCHTFMCNLQENSVRITAFGKFKSMSSVVARNLSNEYNIKVT
jgi:hypothetical protein